MGAAESKPQSSKEPKTESEFSLSSPDPKPIPLPCSTLNQTNTDFEYPASSTTVLKDSLKSTAPPENELRLRTVSPTKPAATIARNPSSFSELKPVTAQSSNQSQFSSLAPHLKDPSQSHSAGRQPYQQFSLVPESKTIRPNGLPPSKPQSSKSQFNENNFFETSASPVPPFILLSDLPQKTTRDEPPISKISTMKNKNVNTSLQNEPSRSQPEVKSAPVNKIPESTPKPKIVSQKNIPDQPPSQKVKKKIDVIFSPSTYNNPQTEQIKKTEEPSKMSKPPPLFATSIEKPGQTPQDNPIQTQVPQNKTSLPTTPNFPSQSVKQELKEEGLTTNKIQSLLECPICLEPSRPPILTCVTGHIICGNCREAVQICPLCREGFSDTRNLLAEQLSQSLIFNCKFQDQGCKMKLRGDELGKHEGKCDFRPIKCKLIPCRGPHLKGKDVAFDKYVEHLETEHHANGAPEGKSVWRHEIVVRKLERLMQPGRRVPFLLECWDGQIFLQCGESDGEKLWLWVALLGTVEESKSYKATLTLLPGNHIENKILKAEWTGPVHSVREETMNIVKSGLCMVTTESCIKSFLHPTTTTTEKAESWPKYALRVTIKNVPRTKEGV